MAEKKKSADNYDNKVEAVLKMAKSAKMVDFKFVDLPGILQHVSDTGEQVGR